MISLCTSDVDEPVHGRHTLTPNLTRSDEADSTGRDAGDTDWSQIIALYDHLVRLDLSPIVRLNRAIAVAQLDGPEVALAEIHGLPLEGYHAVHATQAYPLRQLGRNEESRAAYD